MKPVRPQKYSRETARSIDGIRTAALRRRRWTIPASLVPPRTRTDRRQRVHARDPRLAASQSQSTPTHRDQRSRRRRISLERTWHRCLGAVRVEEVTERRIFDIEPGAREVPEPDAALRSDQILNEVVVAVLHGWPLVVHVGEPAAGVLVDCHGTDRGGGPRHGPVGVHSESATSLKSRAPKRAELGLEIAVTVLHHLG